MRKFKEVLTFESKNNIAKDLIDATTKYAIHAKAENAGKPMATKLSLSEEAKIINGLYGDLLKSRAGYSAEKFDTIEDFADSPTTEHFAQTIVRTMINAIYPVVFDTPFFNLVCQMHFAGYGDTFQVDIQNNKLYNVSRFGRRQKHTMVQDATNGSVTINTQNYGVTTITNLPAILLGDTMVVEDVMRTALSVQAKVYKLALNEFIAQTDAVTIGALTANAGFDEKTWLKKLKVVKAYSGNTAPIVFGDMIALKTLLPAAQSTRIDLQDPYNTTIGYMDRWNTYGVMGFDAIANDDGDYGVVGLPENRLYAIAPSGNKFIHIAIGATMVNSDDNYENMNLSKLTTVRQEMGVKLVTNEVLAVYKLA